MGSLLVLRPEAPSPARLAAWSCASLDGELGGDARLAVAIPSSEAVVLGAFQRRGDVATDLPVYRRGSGGAAVRVGPGSVWIQLALARPDALVAGDASKILNRYVRPLLRALGKAAPAHYFGRDWVSVGRRPAALVAFAHDASTGRALFEAIVAVTTPFALGDRLAFDGKVPATLSEIAERAIAPAAIADAVVAAYGTIASATSTEPTLLAESDAPLVVPDAPWSATVDEAIGVVAAGRDARGRLQVGGELMASRDAIAALEDAIARGDDPSAAVDASLAAPGVVTFGVRSLRSVRDAIASALAAPRATAP